MSPMMMMSEQATELQSLPGISGRFRRSASRNTSFSNDSEEFEQQIHIKGEATLCFTEDGSMFLGVIATEDGSHYSIQGKKSLRRKPDSHCNCNDDLQCTESSSEDPELGIPVSFDIRVKDHDNPGEEYHLKRVHGRNGQLCSFACSNISFKSVTVHRGHKAAMISQTVLGQADLGKSQVYCGPMEILVKESLEKPRKWVL